MGARQLCSGSLHNLASRPPAELCRPRGVGAGEAVSSHSRGLEVFADEGFAGEVGLGFGKQAVEVREGEAFAFEALGLDVEVEDTPRPAVFDGALSVSEAPGGIFEPAEQHEVVPPG